MAIPGPAATTPQSVPVLERGPEVSLTYVEGCAPGAVPSSPGVPLIRTYEWCIATVNHGRNFADPNEASAGR